MILRAALIAATLLATLAATAFAGLWLKAVPRAECDWAVDFCSDYGPWYLGLAVVCGLAAIVTALAAYKAKSQ